MGLSTIGKSFNGLRKIRSYISVFDNTELRLLKAF